MSRPALWLYRATLAAGPLMIGGSPTWAVGVLAAGWSLCLLTFRASVPRQALRSPLFAGLLTALAWTGFQLVPLGRTSNGGSFEGAFGFGTISIDPGETGLALVRSLTALCAYLATCGCIARWGRSCVLRCVADAAVLTALVGSAHAALGLERIFGLYTPLHGHPPFSAPFVNTNHLAGLLGGCLPVVATIALRGRGTIHRVWRWRVGLLCMLLMLGLANSRAGFAGTAAGLLTLAWMLRHRLRDSLGQVGSRWLGGTILAAVSLATFTATVAWRVSARGERSLAVAWADKARVYEEVSPTLGGAVLEGVGRGGFATAHFAAFGGAVRRHHAESWPVQLWVDLGAPMALAAVALALWGLWRARGGLRDLPGAAAFAAVVAFSVHDLADFSLEMLGVRVVFVAMLATVVLSEPVEGPRERRAPQSVAWALATLSGAGAAFALVRGPAMSMLELQARLDRMPVTEAAEAARRAQSWHPREPVLGAFIGAGELAANRPRESLKWLAAVQRWAPNWSEGHRLLALWLDSQGYRSQAAIEVSQADRLQLGSADDVACRWMRAGDADAVGRAAIEGDIGTKFLARIGKCVDGGHAAVDAALIARDPFAAEARGRTAARLARAQDWQGVLETLRFVPVGRRSPELVGLGFQAHMRLGQADQAEKALERSASRLPESQLWRARFELALEAGKLEVAQGLLVRLRTQSSDRSKEGQAVLEWAANLWRGHGYPEQALDTYRAAFEAKPSAKLLQQMINAAKAAGSETQAQVLTSRKCIEFGEGCAHRKDGR